MDQYLRAPLLEPRKAGAQLLRIRYRRHWQNKPYSITYAEVPAEHFHPGCIEKRKSHKVAPDRAKDARDRGRPSNSQLSDAVGIPLRTRANRYRLRLLLGL